MSRNAASGPRGREKIANGDFSPRDAANGVAKVWERAFTPEGRAGVWQELELRSGAACLALANLGCCSAEVVPDPRHATWRECDEGESGEPAILIPVTTALRTDRVVPEICSHTVAVTGLSQWSPRTSSDEIVDVVAIPLAALAIPSPNSRHATLPQGEGRCLSWSGITAAVGDFAVKDECCRLYTDGIAWLRRTVDAATKLAEDYPEHLAAAMTPPPECDSTLLLNADAFEWRLSESPVIVPSAEVRIVCADSRELAVFISKQMRQRPPVRKAPQVLAPKEEAACS